MSAGSTPNSLKNPFSTPMKMGAEEVSLSTPTFTVGWAAAAPGPRPASSAASSSGTRRRITYPPLRVTPGNHGALEAGEAPVGEQAQQREHGEADHELGGLHEVARLGDEKADAGLGRDLLGRHEQQQRGAGAKLEPGEDHGQGGGHDHF